MSALVYACARPPPTNGRFLAAGRAGVPEFAAAADALQRPPARFTTVMDRSGGPLRSFVRFVTARPALLELPRDAADGAQWP
jgi:hypothetical protein